jgi:hypothetical protein
MAEHFGKEVFPKKEQLALSAGDIPVCLYLL